MWIKHARGEIQSYVTKARGPSALAPRTGPARKLGSTRSMAAPPPLAASMPRLTRCLHSRPCRPVRSHGPSGCGRVEGSGPSVTDADVDTAYMQLALEQARKAAAAGEVPIGAVLVIDGRVVAAAHNRVESLRSPLAHAEMLCLASASSKLRAWRLLGATVYVTAEPCPMCAGALMQARVRRVVYGTRQPRLGADGSWVQLFPLASAPELASKSGQGAQLDGCANSVVGVTQEHDQGLRTRSDVLQDASAPVQLGPLEAPAMRNHGGAQGFDVQPSACVALDTDGHVDAAVCAEDTIIEQQDGELWPVQSPSSAGIIGVKGDGQGTVLPAAAAPPPHEHVGACPGSGSPRRPHPFHGRIQVDGGCLAEECAHELKVFFRRRRAEAKLMKLRGGVGAVGQEQDITSALGVAADGWLSSGDSSDWLLSTLDENL